MRTPILGVMLPDAIPPNARSPEPDVPKLYASPEGVAPPPSLTVYVTPATLFSVKYQPFGSVVPVALTPSSAAKVSAGKGAPV